MTAAGPKSCSKSSKYLDSSLGREGSNFGAPWSLRLGMMKVFAILFGVSSAIGGEEGGVGIDSVYTGEGVVNIGKSVGRVSGDRSSERSKA